IVDDGSKDKTGEIVESYAAKHNWIRVIHRKDRGYRNSAGGEIEAFYDGYNLIKEEKFDYIVKLDGDISFSKDYFELCFNKFKEDPRLGIGGGCIASVKKGKLLFEENPEFHVRGATKIYKYECWKEIEPLPPIPGWDTLDEVKANMKNWNTKSFKDILIIQHKYTGKANGEWKDNTKNGRANYICGYHPLFMITKCLFRFFKNPFSIAPFALFYGYISGYFYKIPQVKDKELIKYLRTQQLRRLFFQKSIWK
ncbi:MAG: glycosyltransferase, partial [Chitinispirillaceae bacterium]|nr:glycosyltransferase [Chitinispirillaceae bacterium]